MNDNHTPLARLNDANHQPMQRHARVFALLRGSAPDPAAKARAAATAARYCDDDTAARLIARGISSFRRPLVNPPA